MANLSPWLMLIIGLIVGWLLAWLFGRGGQQQLQDRVSQLEGDLRTRSDELADCRSRAASLESDLRARAAELENARQRIDELTRSYENQLAELRASAAELGATRSVGIEIAPEADDFTQIKGIGPGFAARLSEAGITRYSDLAAVEPAELPKALGLQDWQKIDGAAWISQAKVLANRPRQVQIGDDLTRLEGIGPAYATRLRAAGITTFRQLADADEATLAEIIGAPAWRRVHYGDWIAQARLAADGDEVGLKALQDQLFSRQGDNLGLIEGIGGASLDALTNAGIITYADLAKATPDQLRSIFSKAGLRTGNFEAWIAEAKLRAAGKRVRRTVTRARQVPLGAVQERSCPQDLEAIKGVGRVYEQRLYAVGIGTYWEVGMLPDTDLAAILEVRDFQGTNLAEIKADAMRLAEETDTLGHTWDGSEPDDFDVLEGIGPVLERRLYAAGICTYEALASATKERLADVCQTPAFQRPDYARWIEQARERLG